MHMRQGQRTIATGNGQRIDRLPACRTREEERSGAKKERPRKFETKERNEPKREERKGEKRGKMDVADKQTFKFILPHVDMRRGRGGGGDVGVDHLFVFSVFLGGVWRV